MKKFFILLLLLLAPVQVFAIPTCAYVYEQGFGVIGENIACGVDTHDGVNQAALALVGKTWPGYCGPKQGPSTITGLGSGAPQYFSSSCQGSIFNRYVSCVGANGEASEVNLDFCQFGIVDTNTDCPEGFSWNQSEGKCVYDGPPDCPDGNSPQPDGSCPGNCTAYPQGTERTMGLEGETDPRDLCVNYCTMDCTHSSAIQLADRWQSICKSTGASCGNYNDEGTGCVGCDTPTRNDAPLEPECVGDQCLSENGTLSGPVPAPGFPPQEPGCSNDGNGNTRCYNGNNPSGPRAADSGGPDIGMDTDGDGTIDTTIDLTEDGKGNLPQGTPFDSDGDGTNDSVIGHDGKAYPDENEDGQPDPGKPPIVDPSQTSNNQDPLCQDDPTTTANECAPGGPANCVENPNTPEKECTDGGGYCVDDPNTLIDECAPDSDDCIDDPNTIEDECGPGHDGDCVEDPTTPELECPAPGSGECIDDPETEEDECGSGKQSVGLSGCQEAPACEGSVFDCALIQLQWETTCTFTIDDNARNSDESLFAPKEEDDGSKLWQDITEIEGFPDFPDPGTASSTAVCPPPLVISTPLGNFSFDISPICPLFNLAGTIILIACSLVGVRALATQIG